MNSSQFTIYAESGEYTGQLIVPELGICPPGVTVAEGHIDRELYYHDTTHNVSMAKAARPSPDHVFNYTTKLWMDPRTLADHKATQWAIIKAAREAALAAPLITPYGVFDATPDASANIIKSVLLANNMVALGYPVAINFTLADNTVVVLDATGMVQVGLVLAAREQTIRAKATTLRARIEAATSVVDVAAVVW